MKQKQLKKYLKVGILLLGIISIITNCQKDGIIEFEEQITEQQNRYNINKLSIENIPSIRRLIQKTGRTSLSRTTELTCGTIELDNILKVTHTEEGQTNYSFFFNHQSEQDDTVFYNYVVKDNGNGTYGEFIFKYTPDEDYLNQYPTQDSYDISNFSGQLDIFKYADFCNSNSSRISSVTPCTSTGVSSSGSTGGPDTPGDNNNNEGNNNNDGGGGGVWCTTSTTSILTCGYTRPPHYGWCYTIVVTGWQCHTYGRTSSRTSLDCDDIDFAGIATKEDDCNTSKEDLKKIFPNISDTDAELLASVINDKGKDFGIDTKEKLHHFLSQAGHEVGGFNNGFSIVENTNFTSKSRLLKIFGKYYSETDTINKRKPDSYVSNPSGHANYVYCCRMGNGNESSGDGYKYRGRGIFQLTGKTNYSNFKTWYNNKYDPDKDFVTSPELLKNNDTVAILSALWYYKTSVLDKIDIDSTTTVKKVTKKVNGGTNGLSDRKEIFNKAKDSIDCN